MKYTRLLLVPALLGCMSLAGCSGKTEKINIQYGQMIKNDVEFIEYLDLATLFNSKQTFMVSVYTQTCSCWSTFHGILNSYIAEQHVKVYAVNYKSFINEDGSSKDNFGLNIASGYTSFAIAKEGKLQINLINGKDSLFTKLDSFKRFMEENIIVPKMFYISLDQVDTLYKTDETSVLYFARGNCGDCMYLDANFLNTYKATNNMYILDCETTGIRVYDDNGNLTPESQIAWNNFKINYYLASDKNEKFGFDTGYVPTLFLLKGNSKTGVPEILTGDVYFNDSIEKGEDEKYSVSASYYTEERVKNLPQLANFEGTKVLKGMKLSDDDIAYYTFGEFKFAYWDQASSAKYHDALTKAFLDYSLPKVTHKAFETK